MKRTFFALCAGFILLSFPARAASFWEGTAVASSYGEFPSAGLYAACSSFPRNTVVEVTNLENGKSVQVLVTRSLDNPGVFIALSPEAASQIQIQIGMVARVKVSLPQGGADNVLRSDAPGMSQDPDLNPQALVARERQKEDSGLAALPVPEEKTQKPVEPKVEEKAVAVVPKATPAPGLSKPDAIESQRPSPAEKALAMKPRNVPETPLSEKTPSAIEAKTETYTPDATRDLRPEALSRESVGRGAGEKASYAMSSPELEAEADTGSVAAKTPEKAQVYEKTSVYRPEGAGIAGALADPVLESRGKPEGALTRMKAPASDSRLAATMAAPELEGELAHEGEDAKAEAFEIARKGVYRSEDPALMALDLPDVQDEGEGGATAEERLVVIRKSTPQTDLSSLALADPSLAGEEAAVAEKPEDGVLLSADERIVASKRMLEEGQLAALSDPEMQDAPEGEALPSADERLTASRRVPEGGETLALADPEMGELPADKNALASVDERPKAAKKQGEAVSFSIPDPEMVEVGIAAAQENAPPEALAKLGKPKGRDADKTQIALAKPELAPEEEAVRPEVSTEMKPEPEGARDLLVFEKTSPDLVLEEKAAPDETPIPERKIDDQVAVKPETDKAEKAKPETVKPEIVESYRKGAEALVALNARKMENLSKGTYYVQVGVYRSGQGAAQAVKGLTPDYPLAFQEVAAKEALFYRVFIGPLKKDESGIVLYRLKSMGFKDAFVRKGD